MDDLTMDMEIRRQVGMQDDRRSQGTFIDNFLNFESQRLESRPHGLHEEYTTFFGSRNERLQFCPVASDRFLTENVFTSVDGV